MPPFTIPQTGRPNAPRSLRTPLAEQLEHDPESVDPDIVSPAAAGRGPRRRRPRSLLPFAGQSVALVHDILPATELVARLVTETEEALRNASAAVRTWKCVTERQSAATAPPRCAALPGSNASAAVGQQAQACDHRAVIGRAPVHGP